MVYNQFNNKTFNSFVEMSSKNPKKTKEVYQMLKINNEKKKKSFAEELQAAIKNEKEH